MKINKIIIVNLSIYILVANSLLFGSWQDWLWGKKERSIDSSAIREEVLRYTPIYTNRYAQKINGVDYGVEVQGGHVQKGILGGTSRESFGEYKLLGYKNSSTAIKVTVNGASRDDWDVQLMENGESPAINLGNATAILKFVTKELPVLPALGMKMDKADEYENAKVIYVTINVTPLAGGSPVIGKTEKEEGWFDPGLRYNYENQVKALKVKYLAGKDLDKMSEQELENLARAMSAERRAIGIQFKNATPAFLRTRIYERNMKKYGDKYGPTISYLRNVQGKSWKEIIESASKPGGEDIWYITQPSYQWGKLKSWYWGEK